MAVLSIFSAPFCGADLIAQEAAQELARHLIDEHYFAKTQSTVTRGQMAAFLKRALTP